MAPDLCFTSRNSIMHLKFSGETTDSDIKSQDRIRRKDTEKNSSQGYTESIQRGDNGKSFSPLIWGYLKAHCCDVGYILCPKNGQTAHKLCKISQPL